jgi:hypothetical protein
LNDRDLQFERHEVICKFEGEERKYESWCRPLWPWILDHLIDPDLIRHFEWDAQKIFRLKDGKRTRIFTEPWTGKRFWDIQVKNSISLHPKTISFALQTSLPKDAKAVCLELYADKSKLSSFGTAKGYPVMARILNLPVRIRNGEGIGGARVVGWLPVVRPNFKYYF